MALIERDRQPSAAEIRYFGVLLAGLIAFFGAMSFLKGRSVTAFGLWGVAFLVAAVYYGVRPMRRPMYGAWMALVYPIGWGVSHLVLAVAYYLVVTPVGWVLRVVGYDPMSRRFDRTAKSYWLQRRRSDEVSRYFRQF